MLLIIIILLLIIVIINSIPIKPLNHLKPNEVEGIDKDLYIQCLK